MHTLRTCARFLTAQKRNWFDDFILSDVAITIYIFGINVQFSTDSSSEAHAVVAYVHTFQREKQQRSNKFRFAGQAQHCQNEQLKQQQRKPRDSINISTLIYHDSGAADLNRREKRRKFVNDMNKVEHFFSHFHPVCSAKKGEKRREWNRNQIILHFSHKLHSMIALLITSEEIG